ncbi:hypothetical protein AXG93_810s1080 [Marchantia polymorpha subsp. ruderalis]|uniref:Uncharacterized protein n=1 Tax=Marchantia polymorpha subsp. ruderalis TaxID=1480154 RepID=A0A176W9K3_MARPO|nr:hypothetical protein AXG93_810s1080 [Marchantia polymorpha subsp. ruderalis]
MKTFGLRPMAETSLASREKELWLSKNCASSDAYANLEAFADDVHDIVAREENRKFLLERKIVGSEDEGALGRNEVVGEDDDVKLVQPSAKVNILDNKNVEEPPAKRQRSKVTPSALEDVIPRSSLWTKRSALVRLRLAELHARRKVKSRRKMQEVSNNAECSKAM